MFHVKTAAVPPRGRERALFQRALSINGKKGERDSPPRALFHLGHISIKIGTFTRQAHRHSVHNLFYVFFPKWLLCCASHTRQRLRARRQILCKTSNICSLARPLAPVGFISQFRGLGTSFLPLFGAQSEVGGKGEEDDLQLFPWVTISILSHSLSLTCSISKERCGKVFFLPREITLLRAGAAWLVGKKLEPILYAKYQTDTFWVNTERCCPLSPARKEPLRPFSAAFKMKFVSGPALRPGVKCFISLSTQNGPANSSFLAISFLVARLGGRVNE